MRSFDQGCLIDRPGAAKKIKTPIGDSVDKIKVNAGTRLVDQAGDAMNETVDSIRQVTIRPILEKTALKLIFGQNAILVPNIGWS